MMICVQVPQTVIRIAYSPPYPDGLLLAAQLNKLCSTLSHTAVYCQSLLHFPHPQVLVGHLDSDVGKEPSFPETDESCSDTNPRKPKGRRE